MVDESQKTQISIDIIKNIKRTTHLFPKFSLRFQLLLWAELKGLRRYVSYLIKTEDRAVNLL